MAHTIHVLFNVVTEADHNTSAEEASDDNGDDDSVHDPITLENDAAPINPALQIEPLTQISEPFNSMTVHVSYMVMPAANPAKFMPTIYIPRGRDVIGQLILR